MSIGHIMLFVGIILLLLFIIFIMPEIFPIYFERK